MSILKPPKLQPGDTVGLISPASPPGRSETIDACLEKLKELGFKPKLGRRARQRNGFLAGTDRERAADVMAMFQDKRVKAVFCVRGGYGAGRILPLLDYSTLRDHPKILVGSSDITALLLALWKKCRLIAFHGPLIAELIQPKCPESTADRLSRILTYDIAGQNLMANDPGNRSIEILNPGRAQGRLIGGNLSVLRSMVGGPFLPSLRRAILFLEEVNEKPYRIDRDLTQLLHSGALKGARGVIVGQCAGCADPAAKTSQEFRPTALDVIRERLSQLDLPIMAGAPFGHVPLNAALPVGIMARMDTTDQSVIALETACG